MVCKVSTQKKKNLVVRSDRFHLHHLCIFSEVCNLNFIFCASGFGGMAVFSMPYTHEILLDILEKKEKKKKEPTSLNLGIKIIGVFLSKFLCISSCQ